MTCLLQRLRAGRDWGRKTHRRPHLEPAGVSGTPAGTAGSRPRPLMPRSKLRPPTTPCGWQTGAASPRPALLWVLRGCEAAPPIALASPVAQPPSSRNC